MVVAHSYGGIVAAEAAADVEAVRHLLLVSSYLPEVGQSLSSFGGDEPAPFLEVDPEGGTFTVRADALAATFLQDCAPEIQREATDRIARQSLTVLEQPVRAAAWQHVPSTYLLCAEDRGTPADFSAGSRPGGQGRRARRRPPPVPLAAGRRPRPDPRTVRRSPGSSRPEHRGVHAGVAVRLFGRRPVQRTMP